MATLLTTALQVPGTQCGSKCTFKATLTELQLTYMQSTQAAGLRCTWLAVT